MGGERFRGAGALGLSTAFLSAGAGEVLATLWRVEDAVTRRFMQHFYAALADGSDTLGALQHAQSFLRDEESTAHPFYWAGFVLVGDDPGPILLATRGNHSGSLLVFAVFLVSVGALAARRGRRIRRDL